MTREETRQAFEELRVLIKKMDVPVYRYDSVHWLSRNLAIRNNGNPNFNRAMAIVESLMRAGVQHPSS